MTACVGGLFDLNRNASRTFCEVRRDAVPGECPAPVHAHFIVSVDDVVCSKLMTQEFPLVLSNPNDKGFSLFGPVSIAHPDFVVARARNLEVLINLARGFISACGCRIPFALAALRPFGRHARTIHAPSGGLCSREIHPGGVLYRFTIGLGPETAHVLG